MKNIVNSTVVKFVDSRLPGSFDSINNYILEYLTFLNLTQYVVYEPEFFLIPPLLTTFSARFYPRGDVYLTPVGFPQVAYPDVNLTFDSENIVPSSGE